MEKGRGAAAALGLMRSHDIVLWGCTGFTGSLVARYFAQTVAPQWPELRWALAGRSEAKLLKLAASLGGPPIIVADATSPDDVARVASNTRVLLSTAGPYALHGSPLVEACAVYGTGYVDINGETGWHRQMIDKYDATARASGSVLVPSSGFDSIPSDLGAQWMAERVFERCGQPTRRISCYVSLKGEFSGGTIASSILSDEKFGADYLANPFLLGGMPQTGRMRDEHMDLTSASFDEQIRSAVAPFGMAPINTRIVRRSVGLLEASDPKRAASLFSRDFCYRELALAPSAEVAAKMAKAASAPATKIKELVAKGRLPTPGQGPSAAARSQSWFQFTLIAEAADGFFQLAGKISGGDPGYDETAKMVAEAAVCLATQSAPPSPGGGFMTPATALGAPLRERLHVQGIKFEDMPVP